MGKFLKNLLNSLVCASTYADNFRVTNCDSNGALTFKIDQDYFENNIVDNGSYSWVESEKTYSKTVPGDNLAFSMNEDYITLTHTIQTTGGDITIGGVSIRLAAESINFQCRYARTVALNQGYTINDSEDTTINTDVTNVLGYSMSVTADLVGQNTNLSIKRTHTLGQIAPTLNVKQTGFGQDISFSMRTFWFNAQTSSTTGQGQTVECNLRLDPVASVSSTPPGDCTCYTQTDCAAPEATTPSTTSSTTSLTTLSGISRPPTLTITAQCQHPWLTAVLTGEWDAVGGFGDHVIYVERTPDSNQKWYILFFDPNQNGWGFSYTGSPKPEPGMFLRRQHPSHPMLDKTVTPLDTERSGFDINDNAIEFGADNCELKIEG